jgi:hypothetical protein
MVKLETYIQTCNRFGHIHAVVGVIDIPAFIGFSRLSAAVGFQFISAIIRDYVHIVMCEKCGLCQYFVDKQTISA